MKILRLLHLLVLVFLGAACKLPQTNDLEEAIENIDSTVVNSNGLLEVSGNKIINKNHQPISLAGNSFFWSNNNWGGERFYKPEVVEWLKSDWETSIVRASMGIEDPGGYIEDQLSNKNRIKTIVEAAISEGIYVIIDWHSHHAEDYTSEAVLFFQEMAELYGDFDNVIYEIYNEPLMVSWSDVIKPYALSVIEAIREFDSDNLIIVGTPEWSQRVDLAALDPITSFENIAYTLHFYSVFHKQELRDRADSAIEKGLPIFVTEWGSIGYTQVDLETNHWMTWCFQNSISHCNWAINDKEEEWSVLVPGSQISNWNEDDLTHSGKLVRNIIKNWPR